MNIATDGITICGAVVGAAMSWVRGRCSSVCWGWWGISIPTLVVAIVGFVSSVSSLAEDTTQGFPVIAHWGVGVACWVLGFILFVISFTPCVGKDNDGDGN
jgi:ABC-type uncharacterized transport system permease subunit